MKEPITQARVNYGYIKGTDKAVRNFVLSVNGGGARSFQVDAATTPTAVAKFLDGLNALTEYLIEGKTDA